jgi:hypothetical protein
MTNAPDTIEMVPLLPIIEKYAENATVAIDIGTYKGTGSTRYIRKGMEKNSDKDKVFISIDIKDEREDFFEQREWEHYILGDSREQKTVDKCRKILNNKKYTEKIKKEFSPELKKMGVHIEANRLADLIMIDTIHEYDFIKQELELWKQLAHPKTIWLFHDTWMFGFYNHMTDAIKEFAEASGIWEYVDITKEAHGLGMLRPK